MEIIVKEKTKNKLIFQLKEATNTICNVLKEEIWNDKDVLVSAYSIDHPLVGIPKFVIETKGKDPKKVLEDAIERLKEKNKNFLNKFKKAK